MMYSILEKRTKELHEDNLKELVTMLFNKSMELLKNKKWRIKNIDWFKHTKTKEEIKNSVYKTVKIDLQNDNDEQTIYIHLPKLIKDQFYFLTGLYKVALFQLYDLPIIYRISSKPVLKFRNNIISVNLISKSNKYYFNVFSKKVPAEIILNLMHRKSEIQMLYDDLLEQYTQNSEYNKEAINILETTLQSWNEDREELLSILGKVISKDLMLTKEEEKRRANKFIDSLYVSNELDIFTKTYMKYNCFDLELINALFYGPIDDRDIKNKRLRLSEYIVLPLLIRLYDIVVSLRKQSSSDRFKIQPNIILEKCISGSEDVRTSVGNIIRYNNVVNPIGEIAQLMQCTLTGPGGFSKENVSSHLRDLHESHFGILCPSDTPDREGCGVVYNIVPSVMITEEGFLVKSKDTNITSFATSLVPFLEHDDPTRLQMASSQIKQTIPIKDADVPLIRTGFESSYLEKSTFLVRAKCSGLVIHESPSFMCVLYDKPVNGSKVDVFSIGYKLLYLDCLDYITTNLVVGDRFKEGDVLCYSDRFIKDEQLTYGKNLLTVIMPYFGYNYEDGIVISESASKKFISTHSVDLSFTIEPNYILLSLQDNEYVPLYKVGTQLKKGQVYARLKSLNYEDNLNSLNEEPLEITAPKNCKITQLRIYSNSIRKSVREYVNFIENLKKEQMFNYNLLLTNLKEYLTDDEVKNIIDLYNLSSLDCNSNAGLYYYKKQKINGTKLSILASYDDSLRLGDKIANRHGNKGVISVILPDDEMPILPDGRRAEIVINPLGIVSRMNVGQLYEMFLGEILYQLKNKMRENIDKSEKLLSKFLKVLYKDNHETAKAIINDFTKKKEKGNIEEAINSLTLLTPVFCSPKYKDILEASKLVNAKEKDYLKVYTNGKWETTKNPVSYGYIFFEKLVHRSEDKLFSRSIGAYNEKTLQPTSDKKNSGGHRLGEMEVWSLLAHDAKKFLRDLLTIQSDSVGLKIKELAKMLKNESLVDNSDSLDTKTKTLSLFEAYLKICGLNIEK